MFVKYIILLKMNLTYLHCSLKNSLNRKEGRKGENILEGKVFRLKRNNFFVNFMDLCIKADIPRDIVHPQTLRYTRAIELLWAGAPVTLVQQMPGHANLNTTAVYLKHSNVEIQAMLKMKGLIWFWCAYFLCNIIFLCINKL